MVKRIIIIQFPRTNLLVTREIIEDKVISITMDKMVKKRDLKIKTKEEEILLIRRQLKDKFISRKMKIRMLKTHKRKKLKRRISLIMKRTSLLQDRTTRTLITPLARKKSLSLTLKLLQRVNHRKLKLKRIVLAES